MIAKAFLTVVLQFCMSQITADDVKENIKPKLQKCIKTEIIAMRKELDELERTFNAKND